MTTTGTCSAIERADLEHRVDGRAGPQRGGPRGVDHGPVGERVGERNAELDQIGAASA